jgi:hypothetical protein
LILAAAGGGSSSVMEGYFQRTLILAAAGGGSSSVMEEFQRTLICWLEAAISGDNISVMQMSSVQEAAAEVRAAM